LKRGETVNAAIKSFSNSCRRFSNPKQRMPERLHNVPKVKAIAFCSSERKCGQTVFSKLVAAQTFG
jgi:hypothetical protein